MTPHQVELRNPCLDSSRLVSRLGLLVPLLAAVLVGIGLSQPTRTGTRECLLIAGLSVFVFTPLTFLGTYVLRKNGRELEKDLQAYKAGEYLAYWTYPAAQWDAILAAGERRERKGDRLIAAVILCVGIAVAGLLNFPPGNPELSWTVKALLPLGGAAALALVICGISFVARARAGARFRREGGHAFISAESAYFSGQSKAWIRGRARLIDAEVRPAELTNPGDPPILVVKAERVVKSSVSETMGAVGEGISPLAVRANAIVLLRIPVPTGRDGEAEQLAASLREHIASSKKPGRTQR